MKYEKIMQELKAGTFHPVYLLHGDESFFIDSVTSYIQKLSDHSIKRSFMEKISTSKL